MSTVFDAYKSKCKCYRSQLIFPSGIEKAVVTFAGLCQGSSLFSRASDSSPDLTCTTHNTSSQN